MKGVVLGFSTNRGGGGEMAKKWKQNKLWGDNPLKLW